MDLKKIISQGESETVEFKKSLSESKEIIKTISAFANTKGGRIFDDRIEIWNPGKLPPPLTPKDLKEEHKSIPVNPFLANLLFLIKYIERWGTGTNDIIKWCREEDLPEPIFKEITGGFAVVLRKFQISENLESLELNERQKKALEYLKIHKNITRKIYIEINNISPGQANKDLNDLLEKRLIRKQGRKGYLI